jgi:hypothetical protein
MFVVSRLSRQLSSFNFYPHTFLPAWQNWFLSLWCRETKEISTGTPLIRERLIFANTFFLLLTAYFYIRRICKNFVFLNPLKWSEPGVICTMYFKI